MIKENSSLRNKLIELAGQNETQAKTISGLNRKLEDVNAKLKKIDNANKPQTNIANLNELRTSRKKQMFKTLDSKSIEEPLKEDTKGLVEKEANDSVKFKKLNEPTVTKTIGLKSTTAKLIMCKPSAQETLGEGSPDSTSKRLQTPTKNTKLIQKKPNAEIKEENKWKCIHTEELAKEITSLVTFDQYLISSSNVIKLWDINKKLTIAETPINTPNILYAYNLQKVLITASESILNFYLLPGLELIQSIDTGLESINTVYTDKNILFVGGKGASGALQLWDIRTMTRLSAKEKKSENDVYSILTKKAMIYYGGNNRCVNRVSLDTLVSV